MSKFNAPEAFNFAQPATWPAWIQRFSRFRIATKLNKENSEVQVNSLLYAMGKDAEAIFGSFTFAEASHANNYETVVGKFNEHFVPRRNVIHERACFHQRAQRSGETVEAFVRCLYELAEYCEFGASKEEQIRDRVVIGIADRDVSQRLQMEPELTLDKAVQIAQQSELIKTQNASGGAAAEVHGHRKGTRRFTGPPNKERAGERKQAIDCTRCNRTHTENNCPARNKRCRRCNKLGHFAIACKTKNVKGLVVCESASEDRWCITLPIHGRSVKFKIDTGADITIMSRSTYESLQGRPPLVKTSINVKSPGGKVSCMGKFLANTESKGKKFELWLCCRWAIC